VDPEDEPAYRLVRQKLGFVPRQLMGSEGMAATLTDLRGTSLQEAIGCSPEPYRSLIRVLDDTQISGRDPLNQSLYLASKSFLPNRILTTLGDRVEMAHSIEARLPFLDHEVVEFLTRLPVNLKIRTLLRSTTEKYILKQAARPHLTDAIYHRRKHPFTAPPTVSTASHPMSEIVEDTIRGSDLRALDLYDRRKLIALHEQSKGNGMVSRVMQHVAGLAVMQRQFGLTL
jgi:asparagine synthase (glutamine-hydrolysing)